MESEKAEPAGGPLPPRRDGREAAREREPGPRVLVVDDEESITDLVTTALRYEGFRVEVARSGRGALTAATSFRGGAGIVLGSAVTAPYATLQNWPTVVPTWVMAGGIAATLIIGGVAGLYPAIRAARVTPHRSARCHLTAAFPKPFPGRRSGANEGNKRPRKLFVLPDLGAGGSTPARPSRRDGTSDALTTTCRIA